MVYQTVVTPALGEVLAGYNCTVFAYGQTGTGKTHTMEGDLTSQMGTYSAEAGIIPRTLYRLFHQLELSEKEYSVHASFVELYNEELRDLLSIDQPKSLAAGGLRMYDDKNKGVVLQGLEDIPMSDASHGLELLRRGSHKRQIASTNCNEASSRSHSVFTLTVHTKETTAKGEDVVRVGKLNLVDLAGSENIGRSGAENKRAREAGMINQSLLTLGRVINALVEKSSHVPYRESKLTRLLQESLGGRTKTCIIATVSADRTNLEETLSTLDYALRAKSIKNRPEMNSRMTRAGLINEYVKEIEKLKRDVLAARLQEGIYISDESYKEMQEESDARKNTADELRRVVEVAESKRASLQEQFEQNMQLLLKRDGEIKAVKTECSEKKRDLDRVIEEARELQAAVAEEKELREAYRNSERKLDRIASGLRAQAVESEKDVGGLFAKLDRKTKVEQSNLRLVDKYRTTVESKTADLQQYAAKFQSTQDEFVQSLSSKLRGFQHDELSSLEQSRSTISAGLDSLRALTGELDAELEVDHSRMQAIASSVASLEAQIEKVLSEQSAVLRSEWDELQTHLLDSHSSHLSNCRRSLQSLQDMVSGIVQQSQEHVQSEKAKIAQVRALAEAASQREVSMLREQNALVSALLQEERTKSNAARDRLTKSITDLVMGYNAERDDHLERAIGSVQSRMTASEAHASAFLEDHNREMSGLEAAADEYGSSISERERSAKRYAKSGETSLKTTHEKLTEGATLWGENMSQSLVERDGRVASAVGEVAADVSRKNAEARAGHDEQRRRLDGVVENIESTAGGALTQLSATLEGVRDISTTCSGLTSQQATETSRFFTHLDESLQGMQASTRRHLSDEFARDVPTGLTPVKRDAAGGVVVWKKVPATRQKALEQYRRQVAKAKQRDQAIKQRASRAASDFDGTLPDDSRDTAWEEGDGSDAEGSGGGGSGSENGASDVDCDGGGDGDGDGFPPASDDDDDSSSSLDDSINIGGSLSDVEDETVRGVGGGATAITSTKTTAPPISYSRPLSFSSRLSVASSTSNASAQPRPKRHTRNGPGIATLPSMRAGVPHPPPARSVSATTASAIQRQVLSEKKNVDANVVNNVNGKAAAAAAMTGRKPSAAAGGIPTATAAVANGATRRNTRASEMR